MDAEIKTENMMDQLSQLPMGEIAKRTKEYIDLKSRMKYFKKQNAAMKQRPSAQDIIDSTDTKIRSPAMEQYYFTKNNGKLCLFRKGYNHGIYIKDKSGMNEKIKFLNKDLGLE